VTEPAGTEIETSTSAVIPSWPELRTGFSYAMNLMQDPTSGDQRALRLLTALHESIASKGRSRRRRV
jgi:hypothetical protein